MRFALAVLVLGSIVFLVASPTDAITADDTPLRPLAFVEPPPARMARPAPAPRMQPALFVVSDDDSDTALEPEPELHSDEDVAASDDLVVQLRPLEPPPPPTVQGIEGRVTDAATGEPLAGVTIIATASSHTESLAAITDDDGRYAIVTAGPGTFRMTVYYLAVELARPDVVVNRERMTPISHRLDVPDVPPIIFGCGMTVENTYVVEPASPDGLTFE